MRRLAEPGVLTASAFASLATVALCYPRFELWAGRAYALWYLEAVVLLGSFVLWAFVFAWHTPYTGRPVFTLQIAPRTWLSATVISVIVAAIIYTFLDPAFRRIVPEEFPTNFEQWLAIALFGLVFNQLFLVFAPFAWLMRLTRRRTIAVALTILFGVIVLLLRSRLAPGPRPAFFMTELIAVRVTLESLSLYFYWRGGVVLASWCALLVQARHLLNLGVG